MRVKVRKEGRVEAIVDARAKARYKEAKTGNFSEAGKAFSLDDMIGRIKSIIAQA